MTTLTERIRQIGPHWAVTFLIMILMILLVEQIVGALAVWQTLLIALLVAFGYPPLVRALGIAPEVWQKE